MLTSDRINEAAKKSGWGIMVVLSLVLTLLMAGSPASAAPVTTADGDVGTESWSGKKCETWMHYPENAEVCAIVNFHDFYGWQQGLARVTPDGYVNRVTIFEVELYRSRDGGPWVKIAESTGPKTVYNTNSLVDHWSEWSKDTVCICDWYKAYITVEIEWLDGSTTFSTLESYPG